MSALPKSPAPTYIGQQETARRACNLVAIMPEGNSSRLAAKANKLYWQTSQPAGRLADELGVSRSKFYALIEPIHLAVSCPDCGEALVFGSRSDREAGRGHCPECGEVTELSVEQRTAEASERDEPVVRLPSATIVRDWAASAGTRELWALALVGAAAGLLAAAAFWRRR